PGFAGRRGCLSFSGSEFRSRLQERRGNGVKNLKGSEAFPDISFLIRSKWKRFIWLDYITPLHFLERP
ncbi:MAG: hypothetical protein WCC06_02645, partial [Candidatus Aminicenantales bacterium]